MRSSVCPSPATLRRRVASWAVPSSDDDANEDLGEGTTTLLKTLQRLNDMEKDISDLMTVVDGWLLKLQDSEYADTLIKDLSEYLLHAGCFASTLEQAEDEMMMDEFTTYLTWYARWPEDQTN